MPSRSIEVTSRTDYIPSSEYVSSDEEEDSSTVETDPSDAENGEAC